MNEGEPMIASSVVFLMAGLVTADFAAFSAKITAEQPAGLKDDRWTQWRPLVGIWEGTSEGKPGKGKVRLEVSFVFGERFLKLAGTADYTNDKGGEHHEDFGYVSYDSARKTHVFRQFHLEGFVNQYVLSKGDDQVKDALELTSESCENTPPGWKARERYVFKDQSLEHTFELAPPNKPFEIYTRASLSRARK
jgi:hypothetical protein